MDIHVLLNRLENAQVALEHPQAVERFLQETEYLREKPAERRFFASNRKPGLPFPMAILGVLAVIVVFIRMF